MSVTCFWWMQRLPSPRGLPTVFGHSVRGQHVARTQGLHTYCVDIAVADEFHLCRECPVFQSRLLRHGCALYLQVRLTAPGSIFTAQKWQNAHDDLLAYTDEHAPDECLLILMHACFCCIGYQSGGMYLFISVLIAFASLLTDTDFLPNTRSSLDCALM